MSGATCPDSDLLTAYLNGERPDLEKHVLACSECEFIVGRLRAFDEPALEKPDWPIVSQQLQNNFKGFLQVQPGDVSGPLQSENPSPAARISAFLKNPILAYVLVLLLIYPAWRGVSRGFVSSPSPATSLLQNARILHLDATRSAGAASPTVSDSDQIILDFFIPIRVGFHYTAVILDSNDRTLAGPVTLQSYDGLGKFLVACPPFRIHPETHTLRVTEVDSRGAVADEVRIPF